MELSMTILTFKSEDIFEDIPDDPDNVIMNIPPQVLELTGWVAGDTLQIEVKNRILSINKKAEDNATQG